MIVAVGSRKGGSGKSTLATSIAVVLANKGDTLLVDSDYQRSSALWASDRGEAGNEPTITCVEQTSSLRNALLDLKDRYQYIVVDTAGRDSDSLRLALSVADIFLSPLRPSQFDLDTAQGLSESIIEAKQFNPDIRVNVVLNQCSTNVNDKRPDEAREYLAHYPDLPVLNTNIHYRVAFNDARALGLGVTEYTDPKAKGEIKAIIEELGL